MLKLEQTEMHFNDGDKSVSLRIILPSQAHGGWPGSSFTIREWKVTKNAAYIPCTDAEVRKYEIELGQVDPDTLHFVQHPTLGRIAVAEPNA